MMGKSPDVKFGIWLSYGIGDLCQERRGREYLRVRKNILAVCRK